MKMKILLTILVTGIAIPVIGCSADNTPATPDQKNEKKPLYWVDTMEPDVHYSAPGKSRMGMELVPVYPGEKKQ